MSSMRNDEADLRPMLSCVSLELTTFDRTSRAAR